MHDLVPYEEPDLTPPGSFRIHLHLLEIGCLIAAVVALSILGLRASLRLNFEWDSARYHLLFAAIRGGMPLSYQMDPEMAQVFEGFPQLAEVVQGYLWRWTGSINATGVANYLAFVVFLGFCKRILGARFGIVTVVALTAPMVVIHTASCYVDLFGNAFLSMGFLALAAMGLFDRGGERPLLLAGLAGVIAATWTKFVLLAPATWVLFGYLVLLGRRRDRTGVLILTVATTLAAVPYLKNLYFYGNPFWPLEVPLVGHFFKATVSLAEAQRLERPPPTPDLSQVGLFWKSLFEINNPYSYPNRPRFTLDQGAAWEAHRMGGFWYGSVALNLLVVSALGVAHDRRRGLGLVAAGGCTLLLLSLLPQSHELRYFLFIPLCWAGLIGMLLPRCRSTHVRLCTFILLALLASFLYMTDVNREHYTIQRVGWPELADQWLAKDWWTKLKKGTTYWMVGMRPLGIFLTGPDRTNFTILDRDEPGSCPDSAVLLDHGQLVVPEDPASVAFLMSQGVDALLNHQAHARAESIFRKIVRWNRNHYGATYHLAMALDAQSKFADSKPLWKALIEQARKINDTRTEATARQRLALQEGK